MVLRPQPGLAICMGSRALNRFSLLCLLSWLPEGGTVNSPGDSRYVAIVLPTIFRPTKASFGKSKNRLEGYATLLRRVIAGVRGGGL
jgi:hypothetical protein